VSDLEPGTPVRRGCRSDMRQGPPATRGVRVSNSDSGRPARPDQGSPPPVAAGRTLRGRDPLQTGGPDTPPGRGQDRGLGRVPLDAEV
jgi:hypothetical protein